MDSQGVGLQPGGSGLNVLVVDDNRDAADSMCMLLRLWGYECRAAYDGQEGLQAACDHQPDCLLMDIAMPGLDGYALARKVRAQPALSKVKLVALTSYSDDRHVRRSEAAGFDFLLVKPTEPWEVKKLMDMISKVVELAGRAEEMSRQNAALAGETKELLKELKEDVKEVKEDIKEIKEDVKELKTEHGEVKEARAEENPGDLKSPESQPR